MGEQSQSSDRLPTWLSADLRLVGALDRRIIGLLAAIEEVGSLNMAAKRVGLSYKGAWLMLERANNLAPTVLVSAASGGFRGGNSKLTAAGKYLVSVFKQLEQEHAEFIGHLNRRLAEDPQLLRLLKPLAIKTTAANQWFGTVKSMRAGEIDAEIDVILKSGARIVVTLALAELAPLQIGLNQDVVVSVNAAEIGVIADWSLQHVSARNCLVGQVVRIRDDGVDAEVLIRLDYADSVVATITQTSAERMGLKPGVIVGAMFKSNAAMLAARNESEIRTSVGNPFEMGKTDDSSDRHMNAPE